MAYFPAAGIGGVMKSEILIDYDPTEMAGVTVTLAHAASAEGHTPESYTITLDNTGEVEQDVKNLGLWTISWTHQGQSYSEEFDVHYYGYFHVMLHEGFTWRLWATAGGIPINQYNSLSQLLADEAAVRRLFIVHDAVDYMCENANSTQNQDLITIINNGLCAKWANLNDYALDNMEADAVLSDLMGDADLYGYGELIEDNGSYVPKGNVPVMTSNTAPYGSVIGDGIYSSTFEKFNAFNKNISSMWVSNNSDYSVAYIGYMFTNPVKIKKVVYTRDVLAGYAGTCTAKLQATNDGTNWIDITEEFTFDQLSSNYEEIEWTPTKNAEAYYLGARLKFLTHIPVVGLNKCNPRCVELQFYGRELKVSVPAMASNTAPYGEVFQYGVNNPAYCAFDKNVSTVSGGEETGTTNLGYYIGYDFKKPVIPIMIYAQMRSNDQYTRWPYTFKIQGSNNGTDWDDLTNEIASSTAATYAELNNASNASYKMVRLRLLSQTHTTTYVGQFAIIDFYGKDYSEKEFANDGSKWLYDHGVELEEFIYNAVGSGSVSEEANDEMYMEIPASSQRAASALASVDLTDYNILRAVAGKQWVATVELTVGPNARPSYASHGIEAYVDIAPPVNKNNLALSVASFNTSRYVGPYTGNNSGSVRCLGTISELWLE